MTQGSSLTARSERLWLLGILLLVVALRFIAAGSDPMPELDAGFISDSGTWWKNPKQHLLWGQWIMDDGNFGILTAPAHALAQRAVFGLFGLGYAQGFLLSGVSGVVSTVLVFGLVRREHDAVPALLAAAFAGIDVLMLAYDRAAYPEPFQLMLMLAAVGAVLASRGRAWLAALGGVAVVAVLLAKPPGLVLAPIAATAWLALWITDRVREPSAATPAQFQWRGFALYTATAAVLVAFVGLVFLRPYAADVWLHFQQQMSDGQALGARVTDRVLLFGTPLGFRLNNFFRYEWYLLVAAGAFGAARIARVIRRRVTAVEVAAWLWVLLGLGVMGLQSYQQDRRFLFLVPPLAMLSAIALAHAVELGDSAWQSLRARRLAMGGAGASPRAGGAVLSHPVRRVEDDRHRRAPWPHVELRRGGRDPPLCDDRRRRAPRRRVVTDGSAAREHDAATRPRSGRVRDGPAARGPRTPHPRARPARHLARHRSHQP
jgi:hypothetical protein